jgi:hypothetical protein
MKKPKVGDRVVATKSVGLIKAGDVLKVRRVHKSESGIADLTILLGNGPDEIRWSSSKIRPLTKLDKYLSEE